MMDPNAKNDDPASAAEAEARRRMEGGAAVPWEYPPGGTGGEPQIDRAITAVEEGACDRLARMLRDMDAAVFGPATDPLDEGDYVTGARFLLAHASELADILSSVQPVEPQSGKETK